MERLNSKFFICEEGHITVGGDRKSKCDAKEYLLGYVKGKRKKWETEVKETKTCGKKIVEEKEIPRFLDLKVLWDHDVMHAFLIGQKIDADFMIGLQKMFSELYDRIEKLEKGNG